MNRAESGQYFKPEVNAECKTSNKHHILQGKSGLLVEFNKELAMEMHRNYLPI